MFGRSVSVMLFFLLFSGLLFPATVAPTDTSSAPTSSECQDGWSQFGSRCFRINTAVATWSDSEQNCVSVGGHLASVHSSEEYTFIQALVLNATSSSSYTWLGATDAAQEGVWVWTDGSAFDYINWSSGQPDNALNVENCLMMNFPVNWNDIPCNLLFTSVCTKTITDLSTTAPSTVTNIYTTSGPPAPETITTITDLSTTVPSTVTNIYTTSSPPAPECQDGWSQFGSRCFRINTAVATWSDSEQNCVSVGGHLASVHSSEEYTFIQALVLNATSSSSYTWLGATDTAQEGVWVWTDGSAFDYINWSSGQPDNYLNVENCLMINFPVNWNDESCNILYPSVCAKCQDGWSQFGSRCFRINTAVATWSDSEQNCVSVGGHLASVHSSEEYTFIQALVLNATSSSSYTWLGATDAAQEGVWVWTDGSAFDYINWSSGQPDNYLNVENCLMINFPVNWNDESCNILYPSVCAKTITTITDLSTTVPSTVTNRYTTSGPPAHENVIAMRLNVISNKDLMASDSLQLFLQQLKGKLIDGGLPSNFTLRLRTTNKKSP